MTETINLAFNPFDPAFHLNCISDARAPIIAGGLMRTAPSTQPTFRSRQTG
jgi:hypothetical protein